MTHATSLAVITCFQCTSPHSSVLLAPTRALPRHTFFPIVFDLPVVRENETRWITPKKFCRLFHENPNKFLKSDKIPNQPHPWRE